MKIFNLLSAAALALMFAVSGTSVAEAGSGAFNARECQTTLTGWSCRKTNWTGLQPYQKALKTSQIPAMYKFLKRYNYPGEIGVTTQADFDAASTGWNKRLNCGMVVGKSKTRDWLVNDAKIIYCELSKMGYPVPKPVITKHF